MPDGKQGRRDFIKKAAYTLPVILTLKATPAFAQTGSPGGRNGGGGGNGGGGDDGPFFFAGNGDTGPGAFGR